MTSEQFAKSFYDEKEYFLKMYFDKDPQSQVGQLIKSLDLDAEKNKVLYQIMNGAITDVMYTILLGLDGCASIGGQQEMYKLCDENGNELTNGNIEGYAYEYFHGKK